MSYIFQNNPISTETWSAQSATIHYGIANGGRIGIEALSKNAAAAQLGSSTAQQLPLLTESVNLTFSRSLQDQYPLNQENGKVKRCIIAGAPTGSLDLGGLYSPYSSGISTFLNTVGDACPSTAETEVYIIIIPTSFGNCTTTNTNLKRTSVAVWGVTLESFGFNIRGGETSILNMPLRFKFTGLDYAES